MRFLVIRIVLPIFALAIYFIPTIVGHAKQRSLGIFLLNLFAGWTVIGWIGALAWAISEPEAGRYPARPPI